METYESLHETVTMEDMKIAALRQIVPEDIDRDIYRDVSDRPYEETMKYIMKQVGIRKEPKPTTGVVPTDVDSVMNFDKDQASEALEMLQRVQNYMNGTEPEHDQGDRNHAEEVRRRAMLAMRRT